MANAAGQFRIKVIDMARFYTMALVFYGHFIERVMYLHNPTAAAHYKFIYSFHMTLFFVLAGYVAKESGRTLGFGKYLQLRFLSRLLPFFFFTAVFMGLAAIFSGDFFHLKLPSIEGYASGLLRTIFGLPLFCVPSWFLLMLFSVELVHYGAFRFLDTDAKILLGALLFYGVGYLLNWKISFFDPLTGRVVGWNYLFIHEAITMYGFYLAGIYLRRKMLFTTRLSWKIWGPGALAGFLAVLFTYRLNSGLFRFAPLDAVVIMFASHGHFFWFAFTAMAGAFLILFLASATPEWKPIVWLGQNTLILMCLNGLFYHFINPPVARWVVDNLSGGPWDTLWAGCAMTAASLALCIPLVYFFEKYLPQLVGRPKVNGPWLKKFISL